MLEKKMWNIFKNTGDIEAYLYYKQLNTLKDKKEEAKVELSLEATEGNKVSNI